MLHHQIRYNTFPEFLAGSSFSLTTSSSFASDLEILEALLMHCCFLSVWLLDSVEDSCCIWLCWYSAVGLHHDCSSLASTCSMVASMLACGVAAHGECPRRCQPSSCCCLFDVEIRCTLSCCCCSCCLLVQDLVYPQYSYRSFAD